MTEDWGDIDGGWEDVDVAKKKKKRARGKQRRATSGQKPLGQQPRRKRPKTHNHPPVGAADNKATTHGPARPWLLPVIGFVLVLGVLALALVATRS